VVLLLVLLVSVVRTQIRVGNLKSSVLLTGLGLWFLAAGAGRMGWLGPGPLGVLSLAAILLVTGVVGVRGWQTLPILLLTVATWAIGLATILQGRGGGLTGEAFGGLMGAGEAIAIAALLSLPVLTGGPPTRRAWMVGLGVAAVVTVLLSMAGFTVTILVLWSFGLPASLPPVLYGLAAGSLSSALFSVWHDRRRDLAAALILLSAGGGGAGQFLSDRAGPGRSRRRRDRAQPRSAVRVGLRARARRSARKGRPGANRGRSEATYGPRFVTLPGALARHRGGRTGAFRPYGEAHPGRHDHITPIEGEHVRSL